MKALSLRIKNTVKSMPIPTEFYGVPINMAKQQIDSRLQWQTVENVGGIFIETDWHDVPIVTYDADTDTYT